MGINMYSIGQRTLSKEGKKNWDKIFKKNKGGKDDNKTRTVRNAQRA